MPESSHSEPALAPLETSRWQRLLADCRHAAVAAAIACMAALLVDWIATLVAATSFSLRVAFSLLIVSASFVPVYFLAVAPLFALIAVGVRLVSTATGANDGRGPGLFDPRRAAHKSFPRRSRTVAALWTVSVLGVFFVGASTILTLKLGARYREPQLTALLLAFSQVALLVSLGLVGIALYKLSRWLGDKLAPRLGRFNPFGETIPALVGLVAIAIVCGMITVKTFPQLGPKIPHRWLIAIAGGAVGVGLAPYLWSRRPLVNADGRAARRLIAFGSLGSILLAAVSFVHCGADPEVKAVALASSPPLSRGISLVRVANDFDRDGFGSLFGETDCAIFNSKIHPMARDIPDNGIDENCARGDFKLGTLATYKKGERMPVPDAFVRDDYNILLITVDTVRYDHTNLGGYDKRKGRNTTPELAKLAARSANFTFANAPSAGTMASIPAILTSRFFHSGIALDEDVRRGMPPKLKPENVLISEVLKKQGYTTGAIVSHYYFNDWGMEQGFDTYDNSVGKKNEPYKVTSDELNELAIQWIGKRHGKKWFLWLHYIDPHGRYVSHPGETEYGSSEEDIYDGELAFTDKRLGRLVDFVGRTPGGNRTIVVVTSDHGDGFGEHGYINHGQDLHREILHVPLVFHVPNIEPRQIDGAVSPIDIFPTLADLAGADISNLVVEGQSLVPQLFYGKDAHDRVVFSETNYGNFLRAAVTSRYKLIRNIKANSHRLWDLKKDPWEKVNVHTKDPKGLREMSGYLDEWIERVVFSRDPESNQVMAKLADHLVPNVPSTATALDALEFDRAVQPGTNATVAGTGKIEVRAVELAVKSETKGKKKGTKLEVALYFRARKPIDGSYAIQIEAWDPSNPVKRIASRRQKTAGGLLGTERWRPGELVRDRLSISIPASWLTTPLEAEEKATKTPPTKTPTTPASPDDGPSAESGEPLTIVVAVRLVSGSKFVDHNGSDGLGVHPTEGALAVIGTVEIPRTLVAPKEPTPTPGKTKTGGKNLTPTLKRALPSSK